MDAVMEMLTKFLGGGREAGLSVLFAFVVPHLLQWLKGSNVPLMQEGAARLNRAVAFGTAILMAVNVHWTFVHGADGWTFTLSGIHDSIGAFLLDVTRQFMLQQGRYRVLATGPGSVNISGALRDKLASGAGAVLVALGLGMTFIGCASVPARHNAVIASTAVYDALAAAQDGADGLLKAEVITSAQRREFSTHLLPALKAGHDLNSIVMAWKPGAPAPAQLIALVKNVETLLNDVASSLPLSAQSRMLPQLNRAAQLLLDLFVQFSGGERPPSFEALVLEVSRG
jgi:hypothetical protein